MVSSIKKIIFECHILRYKTINRYLDANRLPFRDKVSPIIEISYRNESISLIDECLAIITTGFDLSSYVINDNNESRLALKKFKSVLFQDLPILISNLSPEKKFSIPQTYYYQFKFKHFLASTFNAKFLMDSLSSQTDYIPKYELQLNRCLMLLLQAIQYWHIMSTYNYYGTSYVMADPYKEGYEVMTEIGVILCFKKQHGRGLTYLQSAKELQEKTLRGYDSIRIMPDELMAECKLQLSIISINIDVCKKEMTEIQNQNNSLAPKFGGKQKKYYRKKKKKD